MSVICSRCRDVFYSNAEYVNHRCGVKLVPNPTTVPSATSTPTPSTPPASGSTKGLSIAERLAVVLPIGVAGAGGGDDTPLVHESQSQFQNAMLHLARNSTAEHSVRIFPHDVRAILRGVHLLCDRIEEGARP